MNSLITTLRVIHISAGMLALGLAPVAMLTVKGGQAHRRWGKIYFWAMAVVASTAVILALRRPRDDPRGARHQEVRTAAGGPERVVVRSHGGYARIVHRDGVGLLGRQFHVPPDRRALALADGHRHTADRALDHLLQDPLPPGDKHAHRGRPPELIHPP